MSDQLKMTRNIAILVAVAAAVYFIPGGGRATSAFETALWVAFGAGFGMFGVRLYRENRVALHGLGDRHRGVFYAGLALAVFEFAARGRLWETGFGELAWWALLALTIYAFMEVWRHWRSYGGY
jgi:hypothetical protein